MPKASKETASRRQDYGPVFEAAEDFESYTLNFVEFHEDMPGEAMVKGAPNDQCQCPHWGYVFKGRMWWRYGDREEVCEAGDAFYAPAGHTSGADAGSEFLVISPEEQMAQLQAHMAKRAQALQAAEH